MRLFHILTWRAIAASSLFLVTTSIASQPLAFPGAEGWAAYTPGGRGGKVIKVGLPEKLHDRRFIRLVSIF